MSELRRRLADALGPEPRYVIQRELGRGGMGIVFLAWDTLLERHVAIKVLKPELHTAVAGERFLREARTLAGLPHPNVVQVHDVLELDGLACIVMEYVDGRTLREVLATGGRLPLEEVRTIARQALGALAYVHARGIVHRDLKPANIFLVAGTAKLADFGIASHPEADSLTQEGQLVGTVDYMAPEQREGRTADARSDLFALGLVLLEALTARHPSTLDDQAWRGLPAPVARVLKRAVAADPAARWPDADAFRTALDGSTTNWTIRRVASIGLAVVALGALVGGALMKWRSEYMRRGPPEAYELAVVPAELRGSGELGSLLADLVVDKLERFPLLDVMPADVVRSWREQHPVGSAASVVPPGVRHYASLGLERRGDTLLVDVTVRDAEASRLRQRVVVTGDTSRLGTLAYELADSLVRKLSPTDLQDFRNVSFRADADVQATSDFFRGKRAFQQGDWSDAAGAFREALARDPRFLQAAWALMITRRFQREPFGDELTLLLREREALPPFYRDLLDAQLEPDLVQRFRRYRILVRDYRGSPEAMLHYSNELFHRGALVGVPLAATLDTMSRLAEQDAGMHHAATYDLTIWGNLRLGREAAAWDQIQRRASLAPRDDPRGALHRFAFWARFSPWKARLARAALFRAPDDGKLRELAKVYRLGLSMDVPEQQAAIGRLLVEEDESQSVRENGLVGQALALMALGRPGAALDRLDSAAALLQNDEMRLQRLEWPVVLSALGLPMEQGRVVAARAALRTGSWRGAALARARFSLGIAALGSGDTAGARALADTLAAAPEPVSSRLGALLGAQVEAARGAWLEALDRSRPVFVLDSAAYEMGPFARAATYLGRGAWQLALGDSALADREWLWYENADFMGWPQGAPQQGEVDASLSGLARLRRAELAVARGQGSSACEALSRLGELWESSEPVWQVLQLRVANTRQRTRCH